MLDRLFFFSSRRRHTRLVSDWSSDVCSSDLQRISPVAPGNMRSRSFTLALRLHSGSPAIITGRARARCTICGYDTHAGDGIATTSPGPNSVKQALKSDCLEPFETMI